MRRHTHAHGLYTDVVSNVYYKLVGEEDNIKKNYFYIGNRGCGRSVGKILLSKPVCPGSRLLAEKRPPCAIMVPCASKIRCGCNVLKVPCKINTSRNTFAKQQTRHFFKNENCESNRPRAILWGSSQIVDISPLRNSNSSINPLNQPTNHRKQLSQILYLIINALQFSPFNTNKSVALQL